MRIIITGTFGFLGRHTARRFADMGWDVFGIGNGDWTKAEYVRWGLSEWLPGEVTLTALQELNICPDAVVHCAGSGSVAACNQQPYEEYKRTVDCTAQVLEYIRAVSPECAFVYPSSAAVYGNSATLPTRESQALSPVSAYGVYKKIAEELCGLYTQKYGIRGSIIRFFSIYGSGLKKQLLWDACNKLKSGETLFWGTGKETRDWLHIDDAVGLIELAVTNASGECPVVNGATGLAVPVSDVLAMIKEEMGLNGQISFNNQCRVGDPLHYQADVTQALAWGWQPKVPLRAGIVEYINWFKESHL